jgi:hypothetical protein
LGSVECHSSHIPRDIERGFLFMDVITRNVEVFDPLDFPAEVTQHILN